MVNVAVGSPAALVASEVEYDSHEGSSWVGAVIKGGGMNTDGKGESIEWVLERAGIGAVGVRSRERG